MLEIAPQLAALGLQRPHLFPDFALEEGRALRQRRLGVGKLREQRWAEITEKPAPAEAPLDGWSCPAGCSGQVWSWGPRPGPLRLHIRYPRAHRTQDSGAP
eukprot:15462302-Alexandrium_andersonii.AAC.1